MKKLLYFMIGGVIGGVAGLVGGMGVAAALAVVLIWTGRGGEGADSVLVPLSFLPLVTFPLGIALGAGLGIRRGQTGKWSWAEPVSYKQRLNDSRIDQT